LARSHPPTLITLVSRTLREECGVGEGTRILLALSGGGDSMALLHVLALLAKKQGFSLFAHGVDHGLRAEASSRGNGPYVSGSPPEMPTALKPSSPTSDRNSSSSSTGSSALASGLELE